MVKEMVKNNYVPGISKLGWIPPRVKETSIMVRHSPQR